MSNDELDLCGFLNDKHDDKLETASVKKEQVHHTISKNILRDILHRKKSEDIQGLLIPTFNAYFCKTIKYCRHLVIKLFGEED